MRVGVRKGHTVGADKLLRDKANRHATFGSGLPREQIAEEIQILFNTHWDKAARLIKETSYHRRDDELANLYV